MLHTRTHHAPPGDSCAGAGCHVSGVGARCSRCSQHFAGPRGRAKLITGMPEHRCTEGQNPAVPTGLSPRGEGAGGGTEPPASVWDGVTHAARQNPDTPRTPNTAGSRSSSPPAARGGRGKWRRESGEEEEKGKAAGLCGPGVRGQRTGLRSRAHPRPYAPRPSTCESLPGAGRNGTLVAQPPSSARETSCTPLSPHPEAAFPRRDLRRWVELGGGVEGGWRGWGVQSIAAPPPTHSPYRAAHAPGLEPSRSATTVDRGCRGGHDSHNPPTPTALSPVVGLPGPSSALPRPHRAFRIIRCGPMAAGRGVRTGHTGLPRGGLSPLSTRVRVGGEAPVARAGTAGLGVAYQCCCRRPREGVACVSSLRRTQGHRRCRRPPPPPARGGPSWAASDGDGDGQRGLN